MLRVHFLTMPTLEPGIVALLAGALGRLGDDDIRFLEGTGGVPSLDGTAIALLLVDHRIQVIVVESRQLDVGVIIGDSVATGLEGMMAGCDLDRWTAYVVN